MVAASRETSSEVAAMRTLRGNIHRTRWLERFEAISSWKLVAVSRFALALFALAAIYVDPTQPVRYSQLAYQIMAAFVVYSGLIAAFSGSFALRRPVSLVIHAVDIVTFGVLIHLTDGPTSPLFVFLTFALFSATIRWGWRGAVLTTLATVSIYGTLTALSEDPLNDFNRIIIRSAYLIVVGVLFAYFGTLAERTRHRIADLVGSPVDAAVENRPSIEAIVRRAAAIMKARSAIVAWNVEAEDALHTLELFHGRFFSGGRPGSLPELAEANDGIAEFLEKRDIERIMPQWMLPASATNGVMAQLPPLAGVKGLVLFVDCEDASEDLLPVASVTAARIGYEIAQENMRRKLVEAAKAEGREKLARDIHDDVLQGLTAVSIQMASLGTRRNGRFNERLSELRDLLTDQQEKLRGLIYESRAKPFEWKTFSAAARLRDALDEIKIQWRCTTSLTVDPPDLHLREAVGKSIVMLLSEAVANGVRHGKSGSFEIELKGGQTLFTLTIRDDGTGLDTSRGKFDHETVMGDAIGSTALRQRVNSNGWRIGVDNSARGLTIVVTGALE